MPSNLVPAILEQELLNREPALVQSARMLRSLAGILVSLSPDGRRMASRILRAQAVCLEQLVEERGYLLLAPQLIMMLSTAQASRDLSARAKRYAGVGKGTTYLTLSIDAQTALSINENIDPIRDAPHVYDCTRTLFLLLTGVRVRQANN